MKKNQQYEKDFEKFLSHTSEKLLLLKAIKEKICDHNISSLLDVGPGDGRLSIPLSLEVDNYVGVESNSLYVNKLRAANLRIVHGDFPLDIDESFDMVLMSHSLTYKPNLIIDFINKGWELLKTSAILLIITFRAKDDDWTSLLSKIGENPLKKYQDCYTIIEETLKSFGNLQINKVVTEVTTDTLDDMIEALSFVASDGNLERKNLFLSHSEELKEILNEYTKNGSYFFPFQHFCLMVKK
ncbi:class I SAM-dependent methyltransferase [Candidatus Falkowbacteria bacterium]|nr:MAG: class I SAM-dependent methyltransferase [Candidatus Falkowbacteria bacterium]